MGNSNNAKELFGPFKLVAGINANGCAIEEQESKEHRATMGHLMQELKALFKTDKALEESWMMLEAQMDSHTDGNSDSEVAMPSERTVAWISENYVSIITNLFHFKDPKKQDEKDVSSKDPAYLQLIEKKLQQQSKQMEELRAQIEFITRSVMQENMNKDFWNQVRRAENQVEAHSLKESDGEDKPLSSSNTPKQEISSANADANEIPPPPPPATTTASPSIRRKKRQKSRVPAPIPKTREQLEKDLRTWIAESDHVMEVNKERAVLNWLNVFPPQSNHILEKIIKDYPKLIQRFPLKPKTCFKRFTTWEENLFRKVPESEADKLRRKKIIEIEKMETEEQILEEIAKTFQLMERKRVEEQEMKKKKASQAAMGNVVNELKSAIQRDHEKVHNLLADKELEELEVGEISPLDAQQIMEDCVVIPDDSPSRNAKDKDIEDISSFQIIEAVVLAH